MAGKEDKFGRAVNGFSLEALLEPNAQANLKRLFEDIRKEEEKKRIPVIAKLRRVV